MTPAKPPLTKEQERERFHPAGARAWPPGRGWPATSGACRWRRPRRCRALRFRSVGPEVQGGRIVDIEAPLAHPDALRGRLRHRRPVAHGQPRRELDAALRRRVVDHHRRRGARRLRTGRSSTSAPARTTPAARPTPAPACSRRTDGGRTWRNLGLTDSHHIGRVLVDPRDPRTRLRRRHRPPLHGQRRARRLQDRRTAARPGRASSSWTSARAPSTSCRTRAAPTCSTPPCGSARAPPGNFLESGPGQRHLEVHRRGRALDAAGRRPAHRAPPSAASASPWPRRGPRPSTPSSTTRPCAPDIGAARRGDASRRADPAPPARARRARRLRAPRRRGGRRASCAATTSRSRSRRPRLKRDVKAGKITVADLVAYLEDANRDLFERQIVQAEVYRSDDGGATWAPHARGPPGQGLLLLRLLLRPHQRGSRPTPSASTSAGVPLLGSTDGGKTWTGLDQRGVHVDHHVVFVDPRAPQRAGPGQRRRPQPLLRPRRRPGRRSTTCPSASSRPSPSTTPSRTTSWAACRTTA